ncbi:hypothetical protein [Chitinophaga pinensis]|uniref:Uncharacterized protein n=1 Tax=Chitinophaga pinensis (strain ATCC 43595 / DSM 2588 / LMG 13176 / NBRC 15968 / NCIMB 11800 / UQM 2034) TaxID=485918 RepID=A0A979G375_CHIPD|nr:hypothetical protein [Chitinophaga pinensis]ACU59940.1 hypothetical protein Cpin_2452 [Chitinophaga pinensis DSM 2588]
MKKLLFLIVTFLAAPSFAQDNSTLHQYDMHLQQKIRRVDDLIRQRILRSLNRLIVDEQRMKKRLMKSDVAAAQRIFDMGIDSMVAFRARSEKLAVVTGEITHSYNSYLDTLQVAARFLSSSRELRRYVDQLRNAVGISEQIGDYLYKRQYVLKEQLSPYPSFTKDLQRLNKQAYYYRAQIRELSCTILEMGQPELHMMSLLRASSTFRDFFKQHSVLAGVPAVSFNND